MDNINTIQQVVGEFEIPEELADQLSELLIKQEIRTRILNENINDIEKFEMVENILVRIEEKINSIKHLISTTYVPDKYLHDRYMWKYDGKIISGNKCEIIETVNIEVVK